MSQQSISSLLSASGSEYVSQFSLNKSLSRSVAFERGGDNKEHVYENIIRFQKHSKKFASLNRLIVKLRLKTKLFPKMLSAKSSQFHHELVENNFIDDFVDENETYPDFDDGSYTSCLEENIYEDLEFYSCSSMMNCEDSLDAWFQLISTSPDDYNDEEECDFMNHKSIPSRKRNLNCQQQRVECEEDSSATEIFELQKLEIIKKCLISIWYQPNESGIMKSLFLILKEMFNEYLQRRHATMTPNNCNALIECDDEKIEKTPTTTTILDVEKLRKTKLEHFILSITLNKRLITYDKNLKFIFIVKSSPWWIEQQNYLRSKGIEWKNSTSAKNTSFENSTKNPLIVDDENIICTSVEKDDDESHEITSSSQSRQQENIYQQLWNCTNNSQSEELYNRDWEIDSELCFAKSYNNNQSQTKIIMPFSEVIVYYKDQCENNEKVLSAKSRKNPVESWKLMLRSTNYMEDEEDMFMSEYQMKSLKLLENENNYQNVPTSNFIFDDSRVIKHNLIKHSLSMDTGKNIEDMKTLNDSSLHGKYKLLKDNDSLHSSQSDLTGSIGSLESKKGSESFTDRMKNKLRFRTSRAQDTNSQQQSNLCLIDTNLENVEKDLELQVPKMIVLCCKILENEINIKTPGIYRVSGNKTIIDNIRKKFNSPKRKSEEFEAVLQSQDLHSTAGLLKLFIRELNPPLISAETFVSTTKENNSLEDIGYHLRQLPQTNFNTLKYLISHLCKVEKEKEENLMTSSNLAICWGLCLFARSVSMNFYLENDVSKCNVMCKKLIDHFYEIFED